MIGSAAREVFARRSVAAPAVASRVRRGNGMSEASGGWRAGFAAVQRG